MSLLQIYTSSPSTSPPMTTLYGAIWRTLSATEKTRRNPLVPTKRPFGRAEAKLEINPNDGETLTDLAYYYGSVGEFVRASEMLGRAQQLLPQDMYVFYRGALIYAQSNDPERALDSLESAVALGYPTALLPPDPGFETIKAEPQFQELIKNY